MPSKKRSSNDKPEQYYLELGHQLANIYDMGYANRKKAYWFSLLKGMLSGLGGIIGATIGIAIILWILSLFSQVPLIGHFVDNIQNTLNSSRR